MGHVQRRKREACHHRQAKAWHERLRERESSEEVTAQARTHCGYPGCGAATETPQTTLLLHQLLPVRLWQGAHGKKTRGWRKERSVLLSVGLRLFPVPVPVPVSIVPAMLFSPAEAAPSKAVSEATRQALSFAELALT